MLQQLLVVSILIATALAIPHCTGGPTFVASDAFERSFRSTSCVSNTAVLFPVPSPVDWVAVPQPSSSCSFIVKKEEQKVFIDLGTGGRQRTDSNETTYEFYLVPGLDQLCFTIPINYAGYLALIHKMRHVGCAVRTTDMSHSDSVPSGLYALLGEDVASGGTDITSMFFVRNDDLPASTGQWIRTWIAAQRSPAARIDPASVSYNVSIAIDVPTAAFNNIVVPDRSAACSNPLTRIPYDVFFHFLDTPSAKRGITNVDPSELKVLGRSGLVVTQDLVDEFVASLASRR